MTTTTSPFTEEVRITTTEMHTTGEAVRIVESGFPEIKGTTILDKRKYVRDHLDHYRKLLMFEPRGHYDMYGVIIVTPDIEGADFGVLFLNNIGYSPMCGHASIALGRYAVDRKMVKNLTTPETRVAIQSPCGLVEVFVEYDGTRAGASRLHNVPAFLFARDVKLDVPAFGTVTVDICYGGTFYAFVKDADLGLSVKSSRSRDIAEAANAVTEAAKRQVPVSLPDSEGLAYVFGTIVTDGKDDFSPDPTVQLCIFADRQVDRSPCGTGCTARIALQYFKGLLQLHQTRTIESATTGGSFKVKALREVMYGSFKAVVVEVCGKGYYTGSNTFTLEREDALGHGFLVN